MVPTRSPEDQTLIDSLPMGTVTAFRSLIFLPSFISDNPHLFISDTWIDPGQLRAFQLARTDFSGIKNTQQPSTSPPPRVKLEPNDSGASMTRQIRPFPRAEGYRLRYTCRQDSDSAGRQAGDCRDSEPEDIEGARFENFSSNDSDTETDYNSNTDFDTRSESHTDTPFDLKNVLEDSDTVSTTRERKVRQRTN
ncbi:hypothetical protein R3P38DRAFT_3340989 [Favolaschia claudopus]|uniref:Uncharacterized protein n=1 Tax=Favolaschia claudopus TaxID=2862362 RepID=A0AAW0EBP8_9AGAR